MMWLGMVFRDLFKDKFQLREKLFGFRVVQVIAIVLQCNHEALTAFISRDAYGVIQLLNRTPNA